MYLLFYGTHRTIAYLDAAVSNEIMFLSTCNPNEVLYMFYNTSSVLQRLTQRTISYTCVTILMLNTVYNIISAITYASNMNKMFMITYVNVMSVTATGFEPRCNLYIRLSYK